MYIHEIGRIDAEPYGREPHTGADRPSRRRGGRYRWPGRKRARCAPTPIGPTPGPPPPCGMQNVLCRLRCETSAPNSPGAARPTSAFRFAPSTYTCPPCSWTIAQSAADARLEHAVRRRIRDHDRGEVRAVRARLGLEVGHVDVAVGVAGDDDDAHAGHLRRRRIGAVRGGRNQADVAMPFAAARVIRLDHEQPRVLALRAGIGLQRHRGVAGGRAQHPLEIGDDLGVALGLVGRRERMELAELRPRHRDHLGRRVELHRARAQRDHRAIERDVAVGEPAQIAQHLRFGVIAVERRVREERRRALAGPAAARPRSRREESSSARRLLHRRRTRCQIASTSARVVVSSSDNPSVRVVDAAEIHPARERRARGSRASRRRSRRRSCRRSASVGTAWPSRSRPAFRIAVSRCTRRAIAVNPSGP